jgi:hypothetical protein
MRVPTMSQINVVMPLLIVLVLAVALADIRRVARFRLTYSLVWAGAIAIALGCGFIIG